MCTISVNFLPACLIDDEVFKESLLSYRKNRKKTHRDNLDDIMDGKLYKEYFDQNGFLKDIPVNNNSELHVSLQINTDGVSFFHSSSFGIWPVYAMINELDPKLR